MQQSRHAARASAPPHSPLDGLTGPKIKALGALLEHGSIAEAAAAVPMPERTLRRWATEPAFRHALLTERQKVLDGAVSKLASSAGAAVDALVDVLNDEDAAPSARVAAARVVIEQARGAVLDTALKAELEQIEALKEGRRLPTGDEGSQPLAVVR
jgi:hypothetical protein